MSEVQGRTEQYISEAEKRFEERFKVRLMDFDYGRRDFIIMVLNRGVPEEEFLRLLVSRSKGGE